MHLSRTHLTDTPVLPLLFALEKVTVLLGGIPVLTDLSLRIGKGEAVAVTGDSGSGKTVLAHTIAGKHFFRGHFSVPDGDVENFQKKVQVVEQQHRFRNRNNTTDQYYQQRFNSLNAAETITVADDLDPYGEGAGVFSKKILMNIFGIAALINEPLIQLSNGENKRLQMVKTLLMPHSLLILDQPFTGLDAAGRQALSGILDQLHSAGETMLLFTTRRDIPAGFRRVIRMSGGKIVSDGPVTKQEGVPLPEQLIRQDVSRFAAGQPIPGSCNSDFADTDFAFRLHHVDVRYDERVILSDVDWSVKRGECWSLSGPNGAGKSTLLSLITGDNPQAYANDIELFGRLRGTGESIWEIKQKIGLVSPELHLFFDPACNVYAALASGLFDSIGLFRQLTESQDQLVKQWISFLGLEAEQNILLNRLPVGKQRIVLLGRAMIKRPPLLILDEPCQGMDDSDVAAVNMLVSRYCEEQNGSLVYVSHYQNEWPSCIKRHARLEKGRLSVTY